MRAWIKYKGDDLKSQKLGNGTNSQHTGNSNQEARTLIKKENHHYSRFGKEIPHQEIEVNILSYFGCDAKRGAYIASCLISDPKIECKLGDDAKKAVEELKKIDRSRLNASKSKYNIPNFQTNQSIDIEKIKNELREEIKNDLKKETVKAGK